jgi:type I restriction enzyme S subunit
VKPWLKVRLGEVLTPTERSETVDAVKEYRLLGVRLDGQGPFLRETVLGTQTSATKLFRVATADFIYSRLFACRGAFGVIREELDGCYVSGEFPAFVPVPGRVDVEFLKYWFRLPSVIAAVDADCSGSTPLTRNRFKEQFFLALEIPLPPLAEQWRVVARIEELAAQIHEARTLRYQAAEEAEALLTTARRVVMLEFRPEAGALEDVCASVIDNLHSNPRLCETGIPCVRSPDVGYGTLDLESAQRTDEEEYRRRTVRGEPRAGDIVLVREGGGTGKCAVVEPRQRFSLGQRVMILRPNTERILPRFFLHQLLSPQIQEDQIAPLSKGSASPHLNIGALRRFNLVLPPLPEQRRIVAELDALQAEVNALKRLQAETAVELDALLPAILDKVFKGKL